MKMFEKPYEKSFEDVDFNGEVPFVIATEKLDGTFTAFYFDSDGFKIHSAREKIAASIAKELNLSEKLGKNFAVYGELIGPDCGNRYGLDKPQFHPFTVIDFSSGAKLDFGESRSLCLSLGLLPVPVIFQAYLPSSYDKISKLSKGKSALNEAVDREGLVFRNYKQTLSFKVLAAE